LIIRGGNYLNYRYIDGVLIYRRFGQIRTEEATQTFGTDYLIATINPPLRTITQKELNEISRKLVAKSFQDTIFVISVWFEQNVGRFSMRVTTPDKNGIRIERPGDSFWLFRSRELLKYMLIRFQAKRLFEGDRDSTPAYPWPLKRRIGSFIRRIFRIRERLPWENGHSAG
jgi:hypothetical protein